MLGINAPAPAVHGGGVPALGLEKVLFEHTVVDVHLSQHHHLLALDVRGCGLVPHPHADAVAHGELPPVEDGVGRRSLAPVSPVERGHTNGLEVRMLGVSSDGWGLGAEQHTR